jgi:hypothetical protein
MCVYLLQVGNIKIKGIAAIEEEFQANGNKEDMQNMNYIIHGTATEEVERSNDGVTDITRDKGNSGKTLGDFMKHPDAVASKIQLHHLAALRLYTSSSFRQINGPLRKKTQPHPFPATTKFISEAIGKLRAATQDDQLNTEVQYWRGMKDLEVTEEFMLQGGTELGCMSTSTSKNIVASYAKSQKPLIFRITATDFMTRGADVSWLSMYPDEAEILYPPLTYLKPTKQTPIKNSSGFIIDVEPRLAAA